MIRAQLHSHIELDGIRRWLKRPQGLAVLAGVWLAGGEVAEAAVQCQRTLVANVVAMDQPLMFNRLGAHNPNGMMFALRADVVDTHGVLITQGGSATPGQPLRTQVLMPSGGSRGATFQLDGHVWAFNPFQAEKLDTWGYPMKNAGIGSVRFGYNPMAMYIGAQESVLPAAHFSFIFPSAGGANAVPGDYLYRDYAAFGNLGGIWGLLRVSDEPAPAAAQ